MNMIGIDVSTLPIALIFIFVCLVFLFFCGKYGRNMKTHGDVKTDTEESMEMDVLSVENTSCPMSRLPDTIIQNENKKKGGQKKKRNKKKGSNEKQKNKTKDQATSSTSLAYDTQKQNLKDQATSSTSLVNEIKKQQLKDQATCTSSTSLVNEIKKKRTKDQATSSTSLNMLKDESKKQKMRDQATSSTSLSDDIQTSTETVTKPKGLRNLGNTCFMDAMLQNLAWCPKLQIELAEAQLDKFCKMSKSLLRLLKYTHSEDRKNSGYKPSDILSAARQRNSIFNGYHQQDSFEMFNTIIDAIKNEMLQLTKEKDSDVYGKSDEELIMGTCSGVRLFFGTFVTEFKFSSCKHVECVFQRFSSITVPIVQSEVKEHNRRKDKNNKNSKELRTSFETLTGVERGMKHGLMKTASFKEEDFPCTKCEPPRTGGICERTMLILEPPSIMVLHIDRFSENGHGGMMKRNNLVTYPESFDIVQFCSRATEVTGVDRRLCYNLFGVVAHSGSLNSGHYVAYIKTTHRSSAFWYDQINRLWTDPEKRKTEVVCKLEKVKPKTATTQFNSEKENKESSIKKEENLLGETDWYFISDDYVKPCKSTEAIDNQNAYVLMYERIES